MAQAKPGRKSRKEVLLDAVIDALMTSGLNDMSLRGLSAQMDTSHRVLLYHFETKENLIAELVQEVRHREWSFFEEQKGSEKASTGQTLQQFFDHNTSEAMQRYFRLFYEVWGIAQNHPEQYTKFLDGIIDGWVENLSAVLVNAGYEQEPARIRATLVLGALRGLQLDVLTTNDAERVDAAFAALVTLLEAEISSMNNHETK